ncbi:MAG TPA: hypothetical protein VKA70_00640 [Blastocatellia bacterium]|nr:hypothetical protein [Blastocatellia bacterium]
MSSDDLTREIPTGDRLDQLISLVYGIASDVSELKNRVGVLEQRLESLEQKVDKRLHDTRPIWEAVQNQITELRESVQNQITELRTEMTKNFQKIDRKFDYFAEEFVDIRYKQREHGNRLDKLEENKS